MYSTCTYLYTYMYMHDNKGCTTCFPPKMLNNTQPNIYHTFRLLIWCKSNIFFLDLKKKMFPKSSIFASQGLGSTLLLQRSGSQPLASKDEIQGQDFWKSYFIINMYNLNQFIIPFTYNWSIVLCNFHQSELKVKETETGYSTYLNISLVHCIQIMMLIRYIIMYMNSTQLLCAWMENFYRNWIKLCI